MTARMAPGILFLDLLGRSIDREIECLTVAYTNAEEVATRLQQDASLSGNFRSWGGGLRRLWPAGSSERGYEVTLADRRSPHRRVTLRVRDVSICRRSRSGIAGV
jgi:hypothetical protein